MQDNYYAQQEINQYADMYCNCHTLIRLYTWVFFFLLITGFNTIMWFHVHDV